MSYIGRTPTNAALTASDLADGIVTTAKIDADAVTDAKIADDVVGTEHLTANEVDTAALGADAVTGAQLADNAVNSEHYTDGSIDTAHIAADQITNAKIADDQIDSEHYVDGSIDTAHIANVNVTQGKIADQAINEAKMQISNAPTNGYVLSAQSGNTGGLTWAEAGGGEWTKILHTTASNVGQIIWNSTYITSTYQDYKIVWSNIHFANDNNGLVMGISVDNGSNLIGVDYGNRGFKDDGNVSSRNENGGGDAFRMHQSEPVGNDTGESISGFIEIFDPSATDTVTHFLGRTAYNLGDAANQGAHSTCLVGGGSVGYAAVNYLKLYPSSGNFVTGEFTLYGRKI